MPSLPTLPLKVQKGIEPQESWEGYSTPTDLARYMAQVLSVDPNQLLQFEEVIFSDSQPSGEKSKKLWIKTDAPVAIGIPYSGGYNLIYQYPANIPFLWVKGNSFPSFLRKLTNAELNDYNLEDPEVNTAFWLIMEP